MSKRKYCEYIHQNAIIIPMLVKQNHRRFSGNTLSIEDEYTDFNNNLSKGLHVSNLLLS